MYLFNTKCLYDCPFGMWEKGSDNTCHTCSTGCTSCTDLGTNKCMTCGTGYYKYLNDTICAQTCPDGSFIDSNVPFYCQPCSITCVTCQVSAENCTNLTCAQNYYFLNNSCLAECPDTYYKDSSVRRCLSCTLGCQTCYDSGLNKCTKCSIHVTQYYLQIGVDECAPQCNSGEFAD